uniref:Vegetative cell wall protein gp1-like n=2 Tax=Chenopodium quinoa TaxID=63459 RepID=A0A803KZS5_CHEQI
MPRPALMRPTFRPSATQPPPAQDAAPRAPAPTPSASAPPQLAVTSAAPAPSPAPAPAPAPTPTITTGSAPKAPASAPPAAATQQPPLPAIRSPPAITRTPTSITSASPVPQKSPPSSSMPSPPGTSSLPSPPKPKTQPSPPSLPSSQAISRSSPPSPPKPPSPTSPPKPSFPSLKQLSPPTAPTVSPPKPPSPPKPSFPSLKQVTPPMSPDVSSPTKLSSQDVSPPKPATTTFRPMPRSYMSLQETPPPQSQKTQPSVTPPPFTLPPSQLHSERDRGLKMPPVAEYKTALPPSQLNSEGERGNKIPPEAVNKPVVVQHTVGKPKPFLDSYGSDSQKPRIGKNVKPKERDIYRKSSDSEDSGVRIITITGENKGAIMELGRGSALNNPHKARSDGVISEVNYNGKEDMSKLKGKGHNNATTKPGVPMHAYMNSNVQGINSSIVFNSTCTHNDPGVHLSVTRKPLNGHSHGLQFKDNAGEKKKGQWLSE